MGIDLEIRRGERIAIMGRSGSGKSTLLHLLGGLDAPTSGQVFIEGRAFSEMGEAERGADAQRQHSASSTSSITCCAEFTAVGERRHAASSSGAWTGRGAGEGEARAGGGRPRRIGSSTSRASSPAASASAARSRARWSPSRPACWPTSRPATSTRTPRRMCSRRCCACPPRTAPRSSSSRTTPDLAARAERVMELNEGLLRPRA